MTRHALALLLFLGAALGPARASAAPASDGGDDGGADAAPDAAPEGIQPTTTPDNLGCAAGRRGSTSGALPVAGLALGVAAIAAARRARRVSLSRRSRS